MKVAIIPARGGSKRIPKKNIRDFGGLPLIAYSIRAALESACFEKVVVSTDDESIAKVALSYGAEVPYLRPASLADDFVATAPVVSHMINYINDSFGAPTYVCCIYATAPFIRSSEIRQGLSLLMATDADYAVSVTTYGHPVQRALRITKMGTMTMLTPQNALARSQDLEETWHDAAQFYWGTATAWLEQRPIFGGASVPVKLPRYRVQDLDTLEDWDRAEVIQRLLNKNMKFSQESP
jgi:pseudaminic acid cytidylyltransferase